MSLISSAIQVEKIPLFSSRSPAMTRMILWYGPDNPWVALEANNMRRTGRYGSAM